MQLGILESYSDSNFSLRVSSRMKECFCDAILGCGFDESQRNQKHLGFKIRVYVNGHPTSDGPSVTIKPRAIVLKKPPLVEYYVSLPTELLRQADDRVRLWIEFMLDAVDLVSQKSGVYFKALRNRDALTSELNYEFGPDKGYAFDLSAIDPEERSVVIL